MSVDFIQLSSGTAVGGAGTSTKNTDTPNRVMGEILAVHLTYIDSPPGATTDVTLATSAEIGGVQTILSIVNAASTGWFYPRIETEDILGASNTFDGTQVVYTEFAVVDKLNLKIAQANVGDSVDAIIIFRH